MLSARRLIPVFGDRFLMGVRPFTKRKKYNTKANTFYPIKIFLMGGISNDGILLPRKILRGKA